MEVLVEKNPPICTVIINRPDMKNAVDGKTAHLLYEAFLDFEGDETLSAAVLYGEGGTFCAGADLKAISQYNPDDDSLSRINPLERDMSKIAPMGPSRLTLSKPVIAAISGFAVAGGLELACWCDLRVAEYDAVFGVFCRRFGVPLIDGGTQRLPRLIGASRAMDLILTGRAIGAEEAHNIGLVNRLVDKGSVRKEAEKLAREIAALPQLCMRSDREAMIRGIEMEMQDALELEFRMGIKVLESGESVSGARRFTKK
ncbi:MAG TPA: crotonase/enoyl-CoA hydratase family protein [Spirochaetota bacterium]|nr:crotonase/enoyl-CoA hydratase family protein [Spirochaetota bacterium]HPF07801.1 crotonase/enoyl-CoA hydratase family protein [Spirochaetota bacterium]HPJ44240.1 crotonase/enoyl-CoA hydratase family protein [Spirochaetota bacterium]HPR39330.1 crotonase/enoyl-CoA hydratase family protein [Spirochaetota bacterium]HRX49187.1 crotonase/enoyl-CoA hydratase family protein [Spirochaetota bacterium]